jgi:hypothetical protein
MELLLLHRVAGTRLHSPTLGVCCDPGSIWLYKGAVWWVIMLDHVEPRSRRRKAAVVKSRSGWVWGGRVIALAVLILLAAYLWRVGLARASALASVFALLVAVITLLAPYLLPTSASRDDHGGLRHHETADPARVDAPAPRGDAVVRSGPAGRTEVAVAGIRESVTRVPATRIAARKEIWVAAVMDFADMEDPEFRRTVLRQMGDRLNLGHSFLVPYRPVTRDHVVEIVDRCWDFRDPDQARAALTETLIFLRPDDDAADHLRRILTDGR